MIRFLVDSSSDYTMEEIKEKGLEYVSLCITINEKTYLGTSGRYNYYSECKLEGFVVRNNEKIFVNDLVKRCASSIENYNSTSIFPS